MKSISKIKKSCNIYLPRNTYSLFLVLSKNNLAKSDNYIIINKYYFKEISNDLIFYLKKKYKFKFIFINKNYSFNISKNFKNQFMRNLFTINILDNLNKTFYQILRTKYLELQDIKLNDYKNINIYYSSNILYFINLYNRFKNVNLIFLEHGVGNFFGFLYDDYTYNNNLKYRIVSVINSLFFKIKGMNMPNFTYYYGISGAVFNIKSLIFNNHKIKFLNSKYQKGFDQLFNFYKHKLKKIKKNKKEYIYLQLPHSYQFKSFKKFLTIVENRANQKKDFIFLIKLKIIHTQKKNDYLIYLKEFFKRKKINFFILDEKYNHIPAEIVLKFFRVNEIYSGYSTMLFSSIYFINKNIKANIFFSNLIKKRYKKFLETKPFVNQFIKSEYINKNINYIDLD